MTHAAGVPFAVGQPVIVGAGPQQDRRWYRTSVQRVDARIVWLDGAPEDLPAVDVQPGEEVACHSWRAMDALYQTTGRVAFTRLAPEPLIGLTIQSVERVQHREYVRVPLSTATTGLYIGRGAEGVTLPPSMQQSLALEVYDLSAGGLRGRSSLALTPGDELTIDLPLPRADNARPNSARTDNDPDAPVHLRGRVVTLPNVPDPLNLRARVVRLIDTPSAAYLTHEIGIAFVDVPPAERERIIRFALDLQRERRRRGMM